MAHRTGRDDPGQLSEGEPTGGRPADGLAGRRPSKATPSEDDPPDGDSSDGELADRILRGDGEAFRLLVERHHPRIFRLVRGILGDWHLSEDVCQDVFAAVHRKLGGFRRRSLLSTWIYRIAIHAAWKARARRRWAQDAMPPESVAEIAAAPDRRAKEIEDEEVFRKLLAPLPAKLREVVVLRDQVGLSYDEIAEVIGCSRGAVEQRLHRAMVALREIWKDLSGPRS